MAKAEKESSDTELLKSLVSLSQSDLKLLREGDLLNYKDDLFRLAGRWEQEKDRDKFLAGINGDTLETIQDHFRRAIDSIFKAPDHAVAWRLETGSQVEFVAYNDSASNRFWYQIVIPNTVDRLMASFVYLLARSRVTPNQFRKCPECESIFFLDRKPDKRDFYCSRQCTSRAGTRKYRKKQGVTLRQKERQRSNQRYDKKIHARYRAARIKRNPRLR